MKGPPICLFYISDQHHGADGGNGKNILDSIQFFGACALVINMDFPDTCRDPQMLFIIGCTEDNENLILAAVIQLLLKEECANMGLVAVERNGVEDDLLERAHTQGGMGLAESDESLVVLYSILIDFLIKLIPLDVKGCSRRSACRNHSGYT